MSAQVLFHPPGDFECPMCGQVFTSLQGLKRHCGGIVPTGGEEPYFCVCGSTFCSPQALASHCSNTGHDPDDEQGCQCPKCGRIFASDEALMAHCGGEIPDDDEPLWCECGRAFCSAQALIAHVEDTGHEQELNVDEYDDLNALDDDVVTRGLSDNALAQLKRRPLQDSDDDDPITREPLQGPIVLELSCGHVFDEPMLRAWFSTHRTCPVCRHEIEP